MVFRLKCILVYAVVIVLKLVTFNKVSDSNEVETILDQLLLEQNKSIPLSSYSAQFFEFADQNSSSWECINPSYTIPFAKEDPKEIFDSSEGDIHLQWRNCIKINLNKKVLHKCLKHNHHVAFMGDCDILKYMKGLLQVLNRWSIVCGATKQERITNSTFDHQWTYPDLKYYADHITGKVIPRLRPTSDCRSVTQTCFFMTKDSRITKFKVEFIGLHSLGSAYITMKDHTGLNKASTYEEFILRFYFRGRFPTAFIISPPKPHGKPDSLYSQNITRILSLLLQQKGDSSQVYWLPSKGDFFVKLWTKAKKRLKDRFILSTVHASETNEEVFQAIQGFPLSKNLSVLVDAASLWMNYVQNEVGGYQQWYEMMARSLLASMCGPFRGHVLEQS